MNIFVLTKLFLERMNIFWIGEKNWKLWEIFLKLQNIFKFMKQNLEMRTFFQFPRTYFEFANKLSKTWFPFKLVNTFRKSAHFLKIPNKLKFEFKPFGNTFLLTFLECHVYSSHTFAQVFVRHWFEINSTANLNPNSNKLKSLWNNSNVTQFKQYA